MIVRIKKASPMFPKTTLNHILVVLSPQTKHWIYVTKQNKNF